MSNDNVPPTVREMFASDRRRLKELERRLSGIGKGDELPVDVSTVDHFFTDAQNLSVPSGSFPAAESPNVFTPTRDSSFYAGFLQVSIGTTLGPGTLDVGCNIGIDFGAGYQFLVSIAARLPTSEPNASFWLSGFGSLLVGLTAGQDYNIRHEYYYPDIGGLGGTASFSSSFMLIAFGDQ